MKKVSVKVCEEPGCVEDCGCLACLEQFHREGEAAALMRIELLESEIPRCAAAISKGQAENFDLIDRLRDTKDDADRFSRTLSILRGWEDMPASRINSLLEDVLDHGRDPED